MPERHPWDAYESVACRDGSVRAEALDVACELMRRVTSNLDVLDDRLRRFGWPVSPHSRMPPGTLVSDVNSFTGERRTAAFADLSTHLAALRDATGGPIPVALEAFWREVGGVAWGADLDQPWPAWARGVREEAFEPLELLSLPELWGQVEDARGERPDASAGRAMRLELAVMPAPGQRQPISVRLPDADADPWIHGASEPLRLVPYLRRALRWGGLPGLARLPRTASIDAVLADLARGLDPI